MTIYLKSEADERRDRWEDFKWIKENYYRPRLRSVIEGVAWCNGHEHPDHSDVMEGQRIMDSEYLALFKF